MTRGGARVRCVLLAGALGAAACAPHAPPLTGAPAPVRIPVSALPPGYRKVVFDYTYRDADGSLKGDGVARLAPPDSARLDFFVKNEAVGDAIIIGDALVQARPKLARDLMPPTPFLWAALGVFRAPAGTDTAARVDGDTLRVEIAGHPAWRGTFVGTELVRLDLIDDGRIPQSVVRTPGAPVRFHDAGAHRSLELTVRTIDTMPPFDAAIWR